MKKKLFALPLLLVIAFLIFSGVRLWNENRVFDNISFFFDVSQYTASYFDEEVLFSLIFIESNGRIKHHESNGYPLVLISEDEGEFIVSDYTIETIKAANFLSPYAIFRIDVALELAAQEHKVIIFNQMEIDGHLYDIGEVIVEKIPPIDDLSFGIGATSFMSRINYLELNLVNDEVEPALVTGVIFYLEERRINLLENSVLLNPGETFDYRFDLSYFENINFSIVPKIELEFLDAPIFLRTPSAINFIDDISKEDVIAYIEGEDN